MVRQPRARIRVARRGDGCGALAAMPESHDDTPVPVVRKGATEVNIHIDRGQSSGRDDNPRLQCWRKENRLRVEWNLLKIFSITVFTDRRLGNGIGPGAQRKKLGLSLHGARLDALNPVADLLLGIEVNPELVLASCDNRSNAVTSNLWNTLDLHQHRGAQFISLDDFTDA